MHKKNFPLENDRILKEPVIWLIPSLHLWKIASSRKLINSESYYIGTEFNSVKWYFKVPKSPPIQSGCSDQGSGVGGRPWPAGQDHGWDLECDSCVGNAECLLEHLSQLGPGASAAAKWQQSALQLEDRRRWDKQAFDLSWRERGHLRLAGLLSSFLSLAVNSSMISTFITNVSPWSIQCIYTILFDNFFLLTSIFLYDTWLLLLPFFFNSGSLLPLRMKHV